MWKNTELRTSLWKELKDELQIDKEKLWKKEVFYPIIMHFKTKYICVCSSLICINTKLNVLFGWGKQYNYQLLNSCQVSDVIFRARISKDENIQPLRLMNLYSHERKAIYK